MTEIIEKLPLYIKLNEELVKLFKSKFELSQDEGKIFPINSLVSIFEHFEALCWKEIKKQIQDDYKNLLPEPTKARLLKYFEDNKDKGKVINPNNLTTALRKLLGRYLVGTRQEVDIKPEVQLKLYIGKEEFWNKQILNDDNFEVETYEVISDEITIGNAHDLYDILQGDVLLDKELNKEKERKEQERLEKERLEKEKLEKEKKEQQEEAKDPAEIEKEKKAKELDSENEDNPDEDVGDKSDEERDEF